MKLRLVSDRFFSPKTETGRLLISTPTLMECNSVVECCADNAEVVSSNLTIPIPLYEEILRNHNSAVEYFLDTEEVTGSNPVGSTLEVWQSGLLQNPAKIPCQVIGTVGSNPTTSAFIRVSSHQTLV